MTFAETIEKINYFWARRDLIGALSLLDESSAIIKSSSLAFLKAKFLHQAGKISSALKEIDGFSDDTPDDVYFRGRLHFEAGRIDEAVSIWESHWRGFSTENLQLYLQAILMSDLPLPVLYEKQTYWASRILKEVNHTSSKSNLRLLPRSNEVINIAYFATSWDGNTIRRSFTHHLPYHDREKFKIYGYSFNPIPSDLKDRFDEVRLVSTNDTDLISQASNDNIHIFLDTTGITPGCRFSAMALRVAPLQYNYLNHFATTGIPNIDFVIADKIAPTSGHNAFYTESISRINGCCLSLFYEDDILFKEEPPCLVNGYVTFGSFSSYSKITEHCISAWCSILREVPNSRFVLLSNFFDHEENLQLFYRRLIPYSIEPSRFLLLKSRSNAQVMESYSLIDIALDTIPYNGGNTTCEALWQGVPVLTTASGQTWVGQYGASILINSGLPELVAINIDEYKKLAINLANDPMKLLFYRRNIRNLIRKELFNCGRSFAQRLENLFIRDILAIQVGSFGR